MGGVAPLNVMPTPPDTPLPSVVKDNGPLFAVVQLTVTFGTTAPRAFRTRTAEQQMNVPPLCLKVALSADAFSMVIGGSSANVALIVRVVVADTLQL